MTKMVFRWGLLPMLAILLTLVLVMPVQAADPVVLELEVPKTVSLGDTITITAKLRDGSGVPIPGANVILWAPASFLGHGGSMRLGQATTDAQGRAIFHYQARNEGPLTLNGYFPGNNHYDPAQGLAELTVQGSGQLHRETAGVRVPGMGVWVVVGLVAAVWSIYFTVMVLLTLIARASSKTAFSGEGRTAQNALFKK